MQFFPEPEGIIFLASPLLQANRADKAGDGEACDMLRQFFLLLFLGAALALRAADPEIHTFSIVAFDPKTGELGVAVESKYFGVGSVVLRAKAAGAARHSGPWKTVLAPTASASWNPVNPACSLFDALLLANDPLENRAPGRHHRREGAHRRHQVPNA